MADDEDQSSRTEDPTQRKLDKLREDGNVPTSKEVNNLFVLFGMLLVIGLAAPWGFGRLGLLMQSALANAGTMELENGSAIGTALATTAMHTLVFLLPLLLIMLVVGYLGGIIQNGPMFSTKPLELNLEKVSPIAGMGRLFSLKSLAEFVKAILKLLLIGGAIVYVLWGQRERFPLIAEIDLPAALVLTQKLMLYVLGAALAVMIVLTLADVLFQRFQYIRQHRMSRQELKDEMRESEGDPHIKQRQKQIRMERMRKRMMAAVPKASVVITNPTHYSIALRYRPEEGDDAPVVVAKGVDAVAMRIREVAREHNIPFYEDPPLARTLYANAELDSPIPLDVYEAVAKVIAFVMKLKKPGRA